MWSPPRILPGLWTPAALGAGAGASLAWTTEVFGATPLALASVLALASTGLALGVWLPERSAGLRVGALWGSAGLASAAPALAAVLPTGPGLRWDGPTLAGAAAALALGLATGWCLSSARRGSAVAGTAVAGLAVPLGFSAPLAGGLAALVLLSAAVTGSARREPEATWLPPLGLTAWLGWTAALTVAVAGYNAVRASVDPSPGGAALALGAGCVAVSVGLGLRGLFRPAGRPRPLGPAALAGLALLLLTGAFPARSWQLLEPLAGRADPRLALSTLLVVFVLPGTVLAGWILRDWRTGPRSRAWVPIGLAVALLVGVDLGPDLRTAVLVFALVVGFSYAWRGPALVRLRGAVLIGGATAVLALPVPWPETQLPEGRLVHLRDARDPGRHAARLDAATPVAAGWGPAGGVLLLRRADGSLLRVLEGLPLETSGRAAAAERMAGHLARALAPRFDRALVLGDDLGLVTGALVMDLVERIEVGIPHPEAVRATAEVDEGLAAALLHPAVTLVRGAGEQVVRRSEAQDIVVEVARTPWVDGNQGLPGPRQLAARRELLQPRKGLYLLVVTTSWLDPPHFRGLLADFLEVFPQAWAFLPPSGADQVLLAGWAGEARAMWDQFLAVDGVARSDLAALGLDSALDLADRALGGPEGLAALAAEGGTSPRTLGLPDGLHEGPHLPLLLLEPHLVSAATLIDTTPLLRVRDALDRRLETRRAFLQLLGDASSGDLEGVFERSRSLMQTEGGAAALDPVIEPYVRRAQELLVEARAGGFGSRKWSLALSELEAARLMNPRSIPVLSILADAHLSLGNVPKAAELYDKVLELDAGNLAALQGRAQAALLLKDFAQAERYFRDAVERNNRSWIAHHNLGEFQANAHRYDEAERHLKQAIGLSNGQQPAPFAALSTVYLERGEIAASLTQANRALALEDIAEHRYLAARAYYELGQLQIALTHAQKGALRDPDHLGSHFIIGLIQGRQEQHTQCARTFKRVLELQPGNQPALENLQRCQAAVGGG